jgi:hypothetical protein
MHDTDEPQAIIPMKPPPPPRREAVEPLNPSGPVEMPTPIPQTDPAIPVEVPQKPSAPREASTSRPPPSRRDRSADGRVVIPPRDSDPEIISRRGVVPIGRAANITTAAMPLASGDFQHLHFPGPVTRRR